MVKVDTSRCLYHACRHTTRAQRMECRKLTRAALLKEIDHKMGLLMEERTQLMADLYRDMDLYWSQLAQQADEPNAGISS